MFAEVLIEYSAKSIDKTFTYKVPEHLQSVIKVGMKVLVPFGPKTINGFITNIVNVYNDEYEIKNPKIKFRLFRKHFHFVRVVLM